MSKFLLTVWPFVGHINPFLSVAKALQARGHSVAFYTGGRAQAQLESEGFTVFPFQHLSEERVWNIVTSLEKMPRGWRSYRAVGILLRALRDCFDTMPDQLADLEPVLRDWRPDAIVSDPSMWGPILVLSETTPVPVALLSTLMGCLIPGADGRTWALGGPPPRTFGARLAATTIAAIGSGVSRFGYRPRVNRVRALHGLSPLDVPVNAYAARLPLYLVPSIPELDFERDDLPPSVHYIGPCIWNKPSHESLPPWFNQLPSGDPWVHVTEGTLHVEAPIVLGAAAQGLANLPMQVILTTGPQRDPAALDLGPIAPNVHVEQYISHSALLPRCSVLVTTGGAGTVMTALQFGSPLVIVPTHWDKPDNARRIVATGAGICLPPRKCSPARLRAAVERVLNEPGFRRNAQRLAQRLANCPGLPGAVELLESLALKSSIPVPIACDRALVVGSQVSEEFVPNQHP
jgi:MGT family glycosyltransferase